MSVVVDKLKAHWRLLAATLLNYATYSTWTLLNKYQFLSPAHAHAIAAAGADDGHGAHPHLGHGGDETPVVGPAPVGGYGVTVPIFVTGLQMVLAGLWAAVAIFVFGVQRRPASQPGPPLWSWATFRDRILPLGAARCVDIGGGNAALVFVSVAIQQVIKSLLPLFVSILSVTVLNKSVPLDTWLSLIPIVGGTVLATLGEGSATTFGVALALLSCFARSFKCVLNAKLLHIDAAPLWPMEILLLEAPSSGCLLLVISALLEGPRVVADAPHLLAALPLNFLGGLLMFFNQASYITVIDCSSAVTCQVLMNLKMLMLIVVSVHVFHTPLHSVNLVGIAISVAGCMLYAYVSGRPRKVVAVKPPEDLV